MLGTSSRVAPGFAWGAAGPAAVPLLPGRGCCGGGHGPCIDETVGGGGGAVGGGCRFCEARSLSEVRKIWRRFISL